ncbi:hypothetical protein FOC1_h10017215, partial [Fusarium oxysporum f. sp. cubense race 1]
ICVHENIPQLQTFKPYPEAYHSLSLAVKVANRRSLTMKDDTTNPTGRSYRADESSRLEGF